MDFDLIQYYCREKYYHKMQTIAKSALQMQPNNAVIKLQYCVSLILQNKIGEALRELEFLPTTGDTKLAALAATIHAQNLCQVPDMDVLTPLENQMADELIRAGEESLYQIANFYLQTRDYEKARKYMSTMLQFDRNSSKGHLIKGWLALNDKKLTTAADCFKTTLNRDPQNFDATLGEILSLSVDDAISRFNRLVVAYPTCTTPLIEKMKFLLMARDWEQAIDVANRILDIDSRCIPALQFKVLHAICIRGDFEYFKINTRALFLTMKEEEPKNWYLFYEFGTLFARLCGYEIDAMKESVKFLEEASLCIPESVKVNIELAYQYYLLRNYNKAIVIYKKAARLDDSASDALIGLIRCRLMENKQSEELRQQIDFLLEVHTAISNPNLLLLQAITTENNLENLLKKAIELKFKMAEDYRFGVQYLIHLDVTFILDALKRFSSSSDRKFEIETLKTLTAFLPGLVALPILLATFYVDTRNFKQAENIIKSSISSNTSGKLKLAEILIHQKNFEEADSVLIACLSQNLEVQKDSYFHFLIGKIHKHKNNFQECISAMENALSLMSESESLKPLELASLYLDLGSCYQILNQVEKASDAIQKATNVLEGTPQENQILVARADLELWKNDYNKALTLLASVSPEDQMYLEARIRMADIYLKHIKDTSKYIDCYKALTDEKPTQENLIRLAEAYFSIRKINEAVETYERAIKKKPSAKLSKKLAELYCKCHQYGEAIQCYREAGSEASMDLANLLFRLERFEQAESTLSSVPLQEKALLLAKIKEKLGDISSSINLLNGTYHKICRTNDALSTQICYELAQYEVSSQDFESAIRHYKLALSHCEENQQKIAEIQISLAKLYLQLNDWQSCQTICSTLSTNTNNEIPLLICGDLAFRKCDFSSADNLFHKLLSRKPDHWLALVRMIEVKRRTGLLKEAQEYLTKAADVNRSHPGLAYCTGLYCWFSGNLSEAITNFSSVKCDLEWGQQAMHNMIEIYLSTSENHDSAELLLDEIKPNSSEEETNRNLLVNLVLLASKDKQLIEKATNELTLLASRDVLKVGASLGLAIGYTLQKQPQRARNVLKIIAKTSWQYEAAEYFERCWLMLAEHYVQTGKLELAHELVKKVLFYNAGCSKAYELQGMIAEKDHKYGDSAAHYIKAWTVNDRQDPQLGYRLGMFFFKCKRYVDAISTCQMVLKKNPEFTKIRKDIYEKSLLLLRM